MQTIKSTILAHHLGNFEGYNLTNSKAIPFPITGQEVIDWNHDLQGEAEFWPSGDNAGLELIFRGDSKLMSNCNSNQLLEIDRILLELGNDSLSNYAKIYAAINNGWTLQSITANIINDEQTYIFIGDCFHEMARDAAWELFEMINYELCNLVIKHPIDGLEFDCKRFLNSPSISSQEISTTHFKILIVTLN